MEYLVEPTNFFGINAVDCTKCKENNCCTHTCTNFTCTTHKDTPKKIA